MSEFATKTTSFPCRHILTGQTGRILCADRWTWLLRCVTTSLISASSPHLPPWLCKCQAESLFAVIRGAVPLPSFSFGCLHIHYSYVGLTCDKRTTGRITDAPNRGHHLNWHQSKLCSSLENRSSIIGQGQQWNGTVLLWRSWWVFSQYSIQGWNILGQQKKNLTFLQNIKGWCR